MTQEITQKSKSKKENTAAAKDDSTLAEAEAQETERKSMKSSSTAEIQWCVPAQPEHRRQDGWTSTPCGSDGTKQDNDLDMKTGERLQKQRPHPIRSGCSDGCVVLAGERLPNQRPLGEDHPEHNPEAQETERKSVKSSSKAANQWDVPAHPEHRRQDGWTSASYGSDGVKQEGDLDTNGGERLQKQRPHPNRSDCSDGCAVMAGERLPNKRPLGEDHPEHNPEAQENERKSISSKVSEFMNDSKEAHVTALAAAIVSEEFLDKDAEILRLIKERRSTPNEEKQRIKDLSKRLKKSSEKRKE